MGKKRQGELSCSPVITPSNSQLFFSSRIIGLCLCTLEHFHLPLSNMLFLAQIPILSSDCHSQCQCQGVSPRYRASLLPLVPSVSDCLSCTLAHIHTSVLTPFFPRSADGRSLCPCCRTSHSSVSSLLFKNAGGEPCLGLD